MWSSPQFTDEKSRAGKLPNLWGDISNRGNPKTGVHYDLKWKLG